MMKNIPNRLGREVTREGWECKVFLPDKGIYKLAWIQTNLRAFNGKGIREESGSDLNGVVHQFDGEILLADEEVWKNCRRKEIQVSF
jgi:hypothetical protein